MIFLWKKTKNGMCFVSYLIQSTFFIVFVLGTLLCLACKKQENTLIEQAPTPELSATESSTLATQNRLFAFTRSIDEPLVFFTDFDQIQNLHTEDFVPWTEAVSVTALAMQFSPPLFLVNKLGVLQFESDDTYKFVPIPLLQAVSAQDFFSTTQGLLFRTFRNELFNTSPHNPDKPAPFLCRYNPLTEQAYPILSTIDLQLPNEAQSTHFQKYKNSWLASFKTESENRTFFDYIELKNIFENDELRFTSISAEEFQKRATNEIIQPNGAANEPLQICLETIAASLEDGLQVFTHVYASDAESKKTYHLKTSVSTTQEQTAHAIWQDNKLFFLLQTGLLYIAEWQENSVVLEKRQLLPLPDQFVYTFFAIDTASQSLVAFWEEQRFFMLGKTGGIHMSLESLNLAF